MKILTREVGVPYANMSPLEVVRVRFWEALHAYCEAKWLEANGWRRARSGWLLPDWHPHKREAGDQQKRIRRFDDVATDPKMRKEPYTQNHAANSQRAHGERGTVQRRNNPRHKAPPIPPHRWLPYAATVNVLSLLVTASALSQRTALIHGAFVLASGLLFCVSFCISHRARRAWELDWAEAQLMRKPLHEFTQIHRSN